MGCTAQVYKTSCIGRVKPRLHYTTFFCIIAHHCGAQHRTGTCYHLLQRATVYAASACAPKQFNNQLFVRVASQYVTKSCKSK